MTALNFATVHRHRPGFEDSIGDIWRLYNDLELALRQSPDNPNARQIVFKLVAVMIAFARQLTTLESDMKDILYGQDEKMGTEKAP